MSKAILSHHHNSSSFTLIELLIVIAILAILMSVVVVTINPAEMLKKSRDSKRLTDLSNLEIVLTMARSGGLLTPDICDGTKIYISLPNSISLPNNLPPGVSWVQVSEDNLRKSNGTGWIPIDVFNAYGLSMPALPVDPQNTPDLYYTFYCNPQRQYILTSYMESKAFGPKGNENSKTNKDGGPDPYFYEVGSNLFISPLKPVGSWSFDEGTGTIANDSSGNNNNGTLYNGPIWTDGQVNKALSFDGVDDYVDAGNITPLGQQITIEFWYYRKNKPTTTYESPFSIDIDSWAGPTGGLQFWGNLGVRMRNHTVGETSVYFETLENGRWYHVVYVWNKPYGKTYLNGNYVNSVTWNYDIGWNVFRTYIGRSWTSAQFNGLIDEVRIYNRALSAEEIKRHYEISK